MSNFQIDVKGIEKVYGLVADLEKIDQHTAIKSGLRKGAGVFREAGKSNLNKRNGEHTGNLRGSFIVKVKKQGLTAYSGFNRSPKVAEEKGITQGNHAHIVDRGTKMRYTKKGYSRGIMPASYFWSDARRDGEGKAAQAVWDGVVTMADSLKRKHYR